MAIPSSPILRGITPETPNFRSLRSDFEPMVANKEEVVRSLIKSIEIALEGDVPMEKFAKDFGWDLGNAQKRVARAFEPDDNSLVLSDLLLQSAY